MANFDSKQWYQITLKQYGVDDPLLSLATQNRTNNGTGSVFFQLTNSTAQNQKWQIWSAVNDTYVLRSGNSGPHGYLVPTVSNADANSNGTSSVNELNNGNTVPFARNYANITDDGFYWTIGPWGDGSYHLTNAVNGSAWHLDKETGNGAMFMSSNITGNQPGQRFIFNSVGKISNKAFETLHLPPTNTTGSQPTETSIDLSDSTGLSPAAIGGISAAVGALVVICVVLGILLFLRRRKRRNSITNATGYNAVNEQKDGISPYGNAPPHYHHANNAYSAYQYPPEAPAVVPVELSQDAAQVQELGAGGQAVGPKPSDAKMASDPPIELDAREGALRSPTMGRR